jgi:short-subunit dehydrogenase
MTKVALITGGATGIGKSVGKVLASRGVTVIISGRRETEGAKALKEIEAVAHGGAVVTPVDLPVRCARRARHVG